jgi:hypothetical protein
MYQGYTSTGANYYYTTSGQPLTNPYGGDTAFSGAPSSASAQPGFWSGLGNSVANILNPVGAIAGALGGSTGGVNGAAGLISNPFSNVLLISAIVVVAVVVLSRR